VGVRRIAPDSIVVSDESDCITAIKKEGIEHMPITVSIKRKSADMVLRGAPRW
jgi:hypothetical protein